MCCFQMTLFYIHQSYFAAFLPYNSNIVIITLCLCLSVVFAVFCLVLACILVFYYSGHCVTLDHI